MSGRELRSDTMTREQAEKSEGKMVKATWNFGIKLIHAPTERTAKLLKVTKSGHCIIEGYEGLRIPPSFVSPV